MKITRFEDLRCWQASRQLVKAVYQACRNGELAKDYDTKSQLRRAALSVMNNIAEGFGRFSIRDSLKFYDISQSSTLEVKSILYVLTDMEYLADNELTEIHLKADETRNLTLAFIKHVRTKL